MGEYGFYIVVNNIKVIQLMHLQLQYNSLNDQALSAATKTPIPAPPPILTPNIKI